MKYFYNHKTIPRKIIVVYIQNFSVQQSVAELLHTKGFNAPITIVKKK